MVSDEGIVGENEASGVLEYFNEKGLAVELIELGLDFSFELGDGAVD